MKIGILGTGNVGGALGNGWARKGHQVIFGVRNTSDLDSSGLRTENGPGVCLPPDAPLTTYPIAASPSLPECAAMLALHVELEYSFVRCTSAALDGH